MLGLSRADLAGSSSVLRLHVLRTIYTSFESATEIAEHGMGKHQAGAKPFILLASAAGAFLFAAYIYFNLGDYTAERGVSAFVQVVAVSSAFGALILLVLETTFVALDRMFPGE
jgi:hypothetical protein